MKPFKVLLFLSGLFCFAIELTSRFAWMILPPKQLDSRLIAPVKDILAGTIFEIQNSGPNAKLYAKNFPSRYDSQIEDESNRSIDLKKGPKTVRLFFYGASVTAGSPFGNWASYPHLIESVLKPIMSSKSKLEVMNFGVSSATSTDLLELFRRTLTEKPDAVFVMTGGSDFCDPNFKGRAQWSFRQLAYNHIYTFRWWIRFTGRQRILRDDIFLRPWACVPHPISREEKDRSLNGFRKNLSQIKSLAIQNNIPVVYIAPLVNKMVPPIPSTAIEKQIQQSQDPKLIEALLKSEPTNAIANFYSGLHDLEEKKYPLAKIKLDLAIENDRFPERFIPSQLRILEELSNSQNNVFVVNLETYVQRYLKDGIIDGRIVLDTMHLNVTGYKMIAEALMESFFRREHFLSETFHYPETDLAALWNTCPDIDRYTQICKRYYGLIEPTPKTCVVSFVNDFESSRTLDGIRRKQSTWEPLYFYGIKTQDSRFLERSLQIFSSPHQCQKSRN